VKRLLAVLIVIAAQPLVAQQLPDGPGAAIVTSRCIVCHEAEIITQQHLSLAGWTNSINKMVRWGSQITPDEREVLQPYLAAHFGPKLAASHAGAAPAPAAAAIEAKYKSACQVCHEANMIEQQHLSKAGWTREIDKMIRWGASVSDADKEPMAEYLASRFPPK
jgi:cytochrome c5